MYLLVNSFIYGNEYKSLLPLHTIRPTVSKCLNQMPIVGSEFQYSKKKSDGFEQPTINHSIKLKLIKDNLEMLL